MYIYIYIYEYIYHIFFIHSSIDGHLDCFHSLTLEKIKCKTFTTNLNPVYSLILSITWKKQHHCLHSIISFFFLDYISAAAAAKLLQLCPTLCDPIDGSPPGSLVPGILQARTLEWVAISFSSAWKWKVKGKSLVSHSSWPHGLQPTRLFCP